MNRLFHRLRWRLVGWTVLVLLMILAVLGPVVYLAVQRSLLAEADRSLLASGDQAAATLAGLRSGAPQEGPRGYRGGIFYVVIGPDGAVRANPQQIDTTDLPTSVQPGRAPTFVTISLDGDPTRVLIRPIPGGGLLYVGQSLVPQQNALRSLLVVLVAGGGLGLLLSLAGGWFLAGRALVPIQQAFRRQQEFVGDASHELRTPLTVLRSAAELLNQRRSEPLEHNGLLFDDMRAEIARMERLASDLLTLARSDRGELELLVAPVDLALLAGEVVRRATPLAQERGVRLELEPTGGAPSVDVEADPDRLQQVLLILLDNAIKHTPAGGRVAVAVGRQGNAAQLVVSDTGSGIAPEDLPRIFDRFYRADTARSRKQGGTGLGLAIAKLLVDAHHGHLALTSTPGVGTQAVVRLPLLVDRPSSLGDRIGGLAARLTHAQARD